MTPPHDEREGMIRRARAEDVPAMVALSHAKRAEYERYQPVFWRMAPDGDERQRPFFERLVGDGDSIVLVAERAGALAGFVIARLVPAPPIYDPGGPTCSIDDFCVGDPGEWATVGKLLLEAAVAEGRVRGAAQTVVVCGRRDEPKRAMLQLLGFGVASEWWVSPS